MPQSIPYILTKALISTFLTKRGLVNPASQPTMRLRIRVGTTPSMRIMY